MNMIKNYLLNKPNSFCKYFFGLFKLLFIKKYNRRIEFRKRCSVSSYIFTLENDAFRIKIKNLSKSGIAFISSNNIPLEINDEIMVKAKGVYIVKWVNWVGSESQMVGCFLLSH